MESQDPTEVLRFRQARAVIEEALSLPQAERNRFVELRCGADQSLLQQVNRLLSKQGQANSLLDDRIDGLVSVQSVPRPGEEHAAWTEFLRKLGERGPGHLRYHTLGELGRGGMGAVRLVYDQDLRRELAMKTVLETDESADPERSEAIVGRFLEEAQVTSQLDHPGIVPVHELGIDSAGQVYFTMKRVRGEDLGVIIQRAMDPLDREWTEPRVLMVLLRVCEAMAFAHAKGVLHRDLKPANIMVGHFGEVYVMDWGLARVPGQEKRGPVKTADPDVVLVTERSDHRGHGSLDERSPLITLKGDVLGTPSYMPPEQARGEVEEMGPHSDVYAVGAMLYQLLTGRIPYLDGPRPASPGELLNRVVKGPPRPAEELRADAPAELLAICGRAMARRPADRYASMESLGNDLRAFLENRVVTAYESGPLAQLRKWIARNQTLSMTAATAMLAVVVLSIWALKERSQAVTNAATAVSQRDRADRNADEADRRAREATARKAEFDQLSGVVLLEEVLKAEADLYPAWPDKAEALQLWLAGDARRLVDLKPTLARTITDLERRAVPLPAEPGTVSSENGREQLAALHRQLSALERAAEARQARAAGRDPAATTVELPGRLEDADLESLARFIQPRIDPNPTYRIWGEEQEALAAARLALSRVVSGAEAGDLSRMSDQLAWALFVNGRDDEAREALRAAVDAAPEEIRPQIALRGEELEHAIREASGNPARLRLDRLREEIRELSMGTARHHSWSFEDESQAFLHATLSGLLADIDRFERQQLRQVEERLAWARQVDGLSHAHPNAVFSWEEAREAIREADGVTASELYREHPIDLVPQVGLVPIGMNPVTLLWEFYHLRSAVDLEAGADAGQVEIPEHAEDGSVAVNDETGIIFVLVPGGVFRMGSQQTDPAAPNHDRWMISDEAPVLTVTLDPFLLGRHEVTVGQWSRLTGGLEPSWQQRGLSHDGDPELFGFTHPVNQVSLDDARQVLERHGLDLPTEAQWERAARAGTSTPWWSGGEPSSLAGVANLLDERASAKYPAWGKPMGGFDDGYVNLAPVGKFRANPFGLYDVHGNLWEWCRDPYGSYQQPLRDGDGLRIVPPADRKTFAYRGGSLTSPAHGARTGNRNRSESSLRILNVGVRAARRLIP